MDRVVTILLMIGLTATAVLSAEAAARPFAEADERKAAASPADRAQRTTAALDEADQVAGPEQRVRQRASKRRPRRKPAPFRWVNPLAEQIPNVRHATFRSPSMKRDVGYCILLPPAYEAEPQRRFPVVYYLHGGRPGNERKNVRLAKYLNHHFESGAVPPMIYVFVNGGPVSHYNLPDRDQAMGADVFVDELIPHIDKSYRTVADRSGRGIEGFSQGGRGTTRIMFRHPELFGSAAPGGAGYATEKRISEENGRETDQLVFQPGDNAYDLARQFAKHPHDLPILIHVGTKGFNYENNLAYMKFLDSLNIPYEQLIVPEAPHSAARIYEHSGQKIMQFHARNLFGE